MRHGEFGDEAFLHEPTEVLEDADFVGGQRRGRAFRGRSRFFLARGFGASALFWILTFALSPALALVLTLTLGLIGNGVAEGCRGFGGGVCR